MKIVVLGSGSWGLAFASVVKNCGDVTVWAKDNTELSKAVKSAGKLPGMATVRLRTKFSSGLSEQDILFIAVPSAVARNVAKEIRRRLGDTALTVVSLSKGLEQPGFKTVSQVLREELPSCRIAVISGPTIAHELADAKPAKAILAAYDVEALLRLKQVLENPLLKFELSRNVVEVEFCAALKGVIAIGVGIADGLDLGKNFTGLLLTYGLHEFIAIGRFLGISTHHVLGIGGLGDLITTAWSGDSRNHRFGILLAHKKSQKQALKSVGMVVEGVRVAKDIAQLASLNVPVDIFSAIAMVIDQPSGSSLGNFVKTVVEHREIL